jgi:lipoprotein NlpD
VRLIYFFIAFFLSACSTHDTYAPVTDLSRVEKVPAAGNYRVHKSDTLYSIAFRYGLDYRELAAWNHIKPPYTIQNNQLISLNGHKTYAKPAPVSIQRAATQPITSEPHYTVAAWRWPARGKVIRGFSPSNKGINIAGVSGESIYATAAGKVVYSGDGLRGYGNLVIIKHNNLYLSAYAHCRKLLVQDGDWVKQGQKIAEMGKTGTDQTMLHFEIRRAGKPVNPLSLFLHENK